MKKININEHQYKLIIESGAYQVFSIGNTIETYYRGTDVPCDVSDFGIDKKYYCTWLADNPYYAAEYTKKSGENGKLYEIKVDLSKYNGYGDWYYDDSFDPYDGFSREDQEELMKEGYNGYTFALDDAEVLVLFDPSLIVSIKELPIEEYLEEEEGE